MESKKKYKLVIIEPSTIVTLGLKEIITSHPEFEITGCYVDFTHFIERVNTIKADIIVVNPTLFSYTKRMNVKPLFAVLPEALLIAIIYSYIDSDVLKQYHGAIQINDDSISVSNKLKQAIKNHQENLYPSDGNELSEREQEILTSVARGMTNKEIADQHSISIHTVISHRKNISRKTGIKTVSGLTVYALLNNMIDQSDME